VGFHGSPWTLSAQSIQDQQENLGPRQVRVARGDSAKFVQFRNVYRRATVFLRRWQGHPEFVLKTPKLGMKDVQLEAAVLAPTHHQIKAPGPVQGLQAAWQGVAGSLNSARQILQTQGSSPFQQGGDHQALEIEAVEIVLLQERPPGHEIELHGGRDGGYLQLGLGALGK